VHHSSVSGDTFELATGRSSTSTGRPFTRTDQCKENPVLMIEKFDEINILGLSESEIWHRRWPKNKPPI
jgi:hypothetical protein